MINYILLAAAIMFILPAPLLIFAALFNWDRIKVKSPAQNFKELGSAIISAGISLFIAIATRPLTILDKIPTVKRGSNTTPILMVHGLYHNKMAWLLMKHRLGFMGFSNINTWQYNSFTTSYPELVLKLRKEICKLCTDNDQKITLVGHSLGGLLISGAASHTEIEKMVHGLITIGTPFKGSVLARVAPGHLGRSLHPKSALFVGGNKISSPANIYKVSIISPTDEMVLPWKNLEPDAGWKVVRTPALGHVAMLYSRRVTAILADILNKA